MTKERFAGLADAYGGDPARWPAAERAEALAWLEASRRDGERLLAEAAVVDNFLDSVPAPAVDSALAARVILAAPVAQAARRAWAWLTGAGVSVGLVAACAAGVAVGAVYGPQVAPQLAGDTAAAASADADADADIAEISGLTDDAG